MAELQLDNIRSVSEDIRITVTAEAVMGKISSNQALAQILIAGLGKEAPWLKLFKQIAEPSTYRPIRNVDESKIDRTRVFNPKTGQWESRVVAEIRGGIKNNAIYTKKINVSLLPYDGKMYLYDPSDSDTVGVLYDLKACDLKDEKYIFPHDAATNSKFWLKMRNLSESKHKVSRSISLQALIEQLTNDRKNSIIPQYNDIMAGISQQAVMGVFATKNTLFHRLNALVKKWMLIHHLKCDVPVFIITPQAGVQVYDLVQQKTDFMACSSLNADDPTRILFEISKKYIPLEVQGLFVDSGLILSRNQGENSVQDLLLNHMMQLPNELQDLIVSKMTIEREKKQIGIYSYSTYVSKSATWYSTDTRGSYHETRYEEPLYMYNWTPLLPLILLNKYPLTFAAVQRFKLQMDSCLEGLLELRQLSRMSGNKLNYPDSHLDHTMDLVLEVLLELNYSPRLMSTDAKKTLLFLMMKKKLKKVNSLEDLMIFAKNNSINLTEFKEFIPKLRGFLKKFSCEKEVGAVLEKAVGLLCQYDGSYASQLLEKIILLENKKCIPIINCFIEKQAGIRIKYKNGNIRENILSIHLKLKSLYEQANSMHKNFIKKQIDSIQPFVDEIQAKSECLLTLYNKIMDRYKHRYKQGNYFKVFFWGGKLCPSLSDKKVPDGIAQIINIYEDKTLGVQDKFDQIRIILNGKKSDVESPSFWSPKRDPELKNFYCEIFAGFDELSAASSSFYPSKRG
jgi:hypothetical protein